MTPRRLDAAALHAKLRILREVVDDLEPLQDLTAARLRQDRILGCAVESFFLAARGGCDQRGPRA